MKFYSTVDLHGTILKTALSDSLIPKYNKQSLYCFFPSDLMTAVLESLRYLLDKM